MENGNKITRRGFVMTGGGAKGLYEAGVIYAFHICGMDFDVITGSSIGAMNSIFFAEYLFRKKQLPQEVQQDPEKAIEALDDLVRAYLHAWWRMPEGGIFDDSEEGPLGKIKADLEQFNLSLTELTSLYWWWTDPNRDAIPSLGVLRSFMRLGLELTERLGGGGELLRIVKEHRKEMLPEALRTYLARFQMEHSLVPPGGDEVLTSFYTRPTTPITAWHAAGYPGPALGEGEPLCIVEPGRTLRDYHEVGIDVRLTRVNYRTGRLEISAYISDRDFVAYLEKQGWRCQEEAIEGLPIGSFRLQIPGNPDAVNAALASGRFPGVFSPYPITHIYNVDRPENRLLCLFLESWFENPELRQRMLEHFQTLHPNEPDLEKKWEKLSSQWISSTYMRSFFPNIMDIYVDGGAIDNTPSNTAVDSVREWAEQGSHSRGDVELDLFEVLLHPEPIVNQVEASSPAFFEVVKRTLDVQGAAKLSADAVAVETINTFGKRGHAAARSLLSVVSAVRPFFETLDEARQAALENCLWEEARSRGLEEFTGESSSGIFDRVEAWTKTMIDRRLPLQVNLIKIHPDEMALSTLQFTERLGYRRENAVRMTTMGCYNALWALRKHLEGRPVRNQHDQNALNLVRKWMGIENWPKSLEEQEKLEDKWACSRRECVFHEQLCRHGKRLRI
jgi:hypothetical protein